MTERGLKNINVFYSTFTNVFYFCHVFFLLFSTFFIFSGTFFYIYGLDRVDACVSYCGTRWRRH